MQELVTTIKCIAIHNQGDNPVFGESVTEVSLQDDAGGPYIEIRQYMDMLENGHVKFNDEKEIMKVAEVAKSLLDQQTVKEIVWR